MSFPSGLILDSKMKRTSNVPRIYMQLSNHSSVKLCEEDAYCRSREISMQLSISFLISCFQNTSLFSFYLTVELKVDWWLHIGQNTFPLNRLSIRLLLMNIIVVRVSQVHFCNCCKWPIKEICIRKINTMLYFLKANSKTIEFTVHTSYYSVYTFFVLSLEG